MSQCWTDSPRLSSHHRPPTEATDTALAALQYGQSTKTRPRASPSRSRRAIAATSALTPSTARVRPRPIPSWWAPGSSMIQDFPRAIEDMASSTTCSSRSVMEKGTRIDNSGQPRGKSAGTIEASSDTRAWPRGGAPVMRSVTDCARRRAGILPFKADGARTSARCMAS
eukprot:scaffold309911_cov28-Tisochrysis_lutea.AAC.6